MRKVKTIWIALLIAAALPAVAFAEAALPAMDGVVQAGRTVTVTAPFGGAVEDYTVKAGDVLEKGAALFTLTTTKVYAPCAGVVAGLRARPGDDAAFVESRYGALMYIEPDNALTVSTNTAYAYNAIENKTIHVGEMVYLQNRTDKDLTGYGYVTKVDGKNYTVEIFEGTLGLDEGVAIFRSANFDADSKIGSGTTARTASVSITGSGSVLTAHVAEGQRVERGDLLFEMVTGTLPGLTSTGSAAAAQEAGIVATIDVKPGATVSAGQAMATMYPLDGLTVAVKVSEMDLPLVRVGAKARVELLGYRDQPIEGVVDSISALSDASGADAVYTAYVSFAPNDLVRVGMNAYVYFEK